MFNIFKILGGLGDIAKLFTPSIESHVQQQFEDELKERLAEYQMLAGLVDNPDRARAIGVFTGKLCVDAGSPPGFVSGQSIEVPLEYFQALIEIAANKIRDDQLLARLSFKSI